MNWFGIAVLLAWGVSILLIRLAMLTFIADVWYGSIGAISLGFAFLLFLLTRTRLQRFRTEVMSVLLKWYSRKFVWVGIGMAIAFNVFMVAIIEIGHSEYSNEINMILNTPDIEEQLTKAQSPDVIADSLSKAMSNPEQQEALRHYLTDPDQFVAQSAIVYGSLDAMYDGGVKLYFSIFLAESVEVMAFLLIFKFKPSIVGINPSMLKP